jgi:hypothetical protein
LGNLVETVAEKGGAVVDKGFIANESTHAIERRELPALEPMPMWVEIRKQRSFVDIWRHPSLIPRCLGTISTSSIYNL